MDSPIIQNLMLLDFLSFFLTFFFFFPSPKEIEDFRSTESFGSQQMNLSIGDDSTGSWSNLSFEDEHQDESSSFHHLSER